MIYMFYMDIIILLKKGVVYLSHNPSGLHGDFKLAVDGLFLRVDEEREAIRLLREVAEFQRERRGEGLCAVVDAELVEVARDDPTRLFIERAGVVVFHGLVVWCEAAVSRLRRVEVYATGFVLNQHPRFGNPRIEELCRAFHGNGHLVLDMGFHVIHAQHFTEKRVPELLILAFLAAALERPVFDKLPCGLPLRRVRFRFHSFDW